MALDTLASGEPAVFLSASIPMPGRDKIYLESADVIAIRECIKALVAVTIPKFTLIWGGHPSITPLIRLLAESHPKDVVDHFVLYQSTVFKTIAPKDNEFFRRVIWVEGAEYGAKDLAGSLDILRRRMITEPNYVAGIFVGGMEGIENEFDLFLKVRPKIPAFPIASTGGAAGILFDKWREPLSLKADLKTEVAYPYLFRRLLDIPATRPESPRFR